MTTVTMRRGRAARDSASPMDRHAIFTVPPASSGDEDRAASLTVRYCGPDAPEVLDMLGLDYPARSLA